MAYTTFQPKDHFNTVAWTGTASSPTNVTGYGFNPDMIWNKYRAGAGDHQLYDAVRTATKMIIPNSTAAESTNANGVTAFITDGFTAGSDINVNNGNSVAWGWKANGSGSSNTDGDITSTVSANTTSGFSIVSYTGNGTASNVGHGLGVAPKVLLIKRRGTSAEDWLMGHVGNHDTLPWKYGINFNTDVVHESGTYFADTAPTSSVFRIEANAEVNGNGGTYIAYCFAEKKGFSKFGSYKGNGNADGTFVYTGFKPALVIGKRSVGGTEDWFMFDNKRDSHNVNHKLLYPNTNGAEYTGTAARNDFLSNGFKLRLNDAKENASGSTYIYMAFAEEPLVSSNNVPATAR